MSTQAGPPVDISRLQEIADGDRDFEEEVISAYIEDMTERVARLSHAIASGDAETARRDAHTVKGASSNVGTTRLHGLGEVLEKMDIIADKEAAIQSLDRIKHEFEAVKSFFENYLRP